MLLSPGTRLGTYEILSALGAGGMGEVYRARDTRLRRDVAVKVLPEAVACSPDRLARFEREARTVAGLNHPNIVTLHSIEEESGIHFLTMELVEGRTLDRLVTPGGLPLSLVLDLAIPLAEALAAAHARGVVHRDLKPGNVKVTPEGRVKVLDFGLAKTVAEDSPAGETARTATVDTPISREGQVLGTVPYMAPEQLRGEAVDGRTDLFALGIVLYELVTGQRPFTGATVADVASSILRDTQAPLARIRPDAPGDLERIVGRCLEKESRSRYPTALDVADELRQLSGAPKRGVPTRWVPPGIASIAVLPFVNRSHSEEDEYFSDGLADELLNVLGKIRGLRVAARTSSFHFKGKDCTIAEVGKVLNVASVLDGSVRKARNRVRIAVQLVSVVDGCHLWSEMYDRTLEDIFAVQDDIAHAVVKELRTTLLGEEWDSGAAREATASVAGATRGRCQSPEAHRLLLQGRYFLDRMTREDIARGIRCLREALALDPGYALAWVELGSGYGREAGHGWVPAAEGYARAREAVERALELEPDLAEGHVQLGWILMASDWDLLGAEVSFRRASELAPGSAAVLGSAGGLAAFLGKNEEAIDLLRRALELDPLNATAYSDLASACHSAGRFGQAEESYRMALELAPYRVATRSSLAMALLAQSRGDEALEEALKEPHEAFRLEALAIIHHAEGRLAEAGKALQELSAKHADHAAFQIAKVHAARGDADGAFEWLERAYVQRDSGLSRLRLSRFFRTLHSDPRWAAFLAKMGVES